MFEATQPLDFSFDDESDQASGPVAYVRVTQATEGIGETYPVRQGTNIIGRSPSCDICIPSKKLSKEHAAIEVDGDVHYVHDMKSRNRSRRGKMFLTPNVRYELSNGCELTFGDVTVCYELKLPEVQDDGSETEPDSPASSPMMFGDTAPIVDNMITSGPDNQTQPSDEVLAADSMEGDEVPQAVLHNNPSSAGKTNAVDSDQETDDGEGDVQPTLILPDSSDSGSLHVPGHQRPQRLADSCEDGRQGGLTCVTVNDSVSDVEATLLLPDEDTDCPSPKTNSESEANCDSTILYSSGSGTEGKGTQGFSPTRPAHENIPKENSMDDPATVANDSTITVNDKLIDETEPTQVYAEDDGATLAYDHAEQTDGEAGDEVEPTLAYPQEAVEEAATQAYGLDEVETQAYGTTDDAATLAYNHKKKNGSEEADDMATQAYGVAVSDADKNALAPLMDGDEPTQAYTVAESDAEETAQGVDAEEATMAYDIGDEPTQAYGVNSAEAVTMPVTADDGECDKSTRAYKMAVEEEEGANLETPAPGSPTLSRLTGEEPTVAYAMDEDEGTKEEDRSVNSANAVTGEEPTVAYAMDEGSISESDDETEYPMKMVPPRHRPVTESVSPSQLSQSSPDSHLPHLHGVGRQTSPKDRESTQLKKRVLFSEEVQLFQQSSERYSEESTEPVSAADSVDTMLPSRVVKPPAVISMATAGAKKVTQSVTETPPPSAPETTVPLKGRRSRVRRSATQPSNTTQATAEDGITEPTAAKTKAPSLEDTGPAQASKGQGGAKKGRGRPKSSETVTAVVKTVTTPEKASADAETRGKPSRGRGRSQGKSAITGKGTVQGNGESAVKVVQPEVRCQTSTGRGRSQVTRAPAEEVNDKKDQHASKECATPSSRRRTSAVKTVAEDTSSTPKTNPPGASHASAMGKDEIRGAEVATPVPVVMFTGFVNKTLEKLVTKLGGRMTTSINECTHLVTERVRRTVKFLGCLCLGKHIVQPTWLEACQKAKQFIDHKPFNVKDLEAEEKFGFDLQQSLQQARGQSVLAGYRVYTSPKCTPEPSQMKEIVRCAGGEPLLTFPSKPIDRTVVVADPEKDTATVKRCGKLGVTCLSAEFILSGVIQQSLNADKYLLSGDVDPPKNSHELAAPPSTPTPPGSKGASSRSGSKRKAADESSTPRAKRRR